MQRGGFDRSHISKIENGRIAMPEKQTRDRIHEILGTSDDDLVESGLLRKHVHPETGGPVYTPIDLDEYNWQQDMHADRLSEVLNAPHMRASFLRITELSPQKQRQIAELIDTFYDADEEYREQMKRDRERREAEGVEE